MITICPHGNDAISCPECRSHADKVVARAEQTQHNYSKAVQAVEKLIFSPSSADLPISTLIEQCWLLPEVQAFMENSRLELIIKEQAMKRIIGRVMNLYVMEKEPNVNQKHEHKKQ